MDCRLNDDPGFRLFGRRISVLPENNNRLPKEIPTENLVTSKEYNGNDFLPKIGSTSGRVNSAKSEEEQRMSSKKVYMLLPCPRCNSTDTKFCYFNNYNVNQPRHFCKKCQRYWTAGGSLRNVPVGAGRRKSKSLSSSQYRELVISDRHLLFPYDIRFRHPGCPSGSVFSHGRTDAVEEGVEGCVLSQEFENGGSM